MKLSTLRKTSESQAIRKAFRKVPTPSLPLPRKSMTRMPTLMAKTPVPKLMPVVLESPRAMVLQPLVPADPASTPKKFPRA